jgi:hypothetical protein
VCTRATKISVQSYRLAHAHRPAFRLGLRPPPSPSSPPGLGMRGGERPLRLLVLRRARRAEPRAPDADPNPTSPLAGRPDGVARHGTHRPAFVAPGWDRASPVAAPGALTAKAVAQMVAQADGTRGRLDAQGGPQAGSRPMLGRHRAPKRVAPPPENQRVPPTSTSQPGWSRCSATTARSFGLSPATRGSQHRHRRLAVSTSLCRPLTASR